MRKFKGSTSRKMLNAPQDSVYVWVNSSLHYPKALAVHLQRQDLQIEPPAWLTIRNIVSLSKSIVLDPDARLNSDQLEAFHQHCWRSRVHLSGNGIEDGTPCSPMKIFVNQNPRIGVLLKNGGASVRLYNVLNPRFGLRGLNWLEKNWPEARLRRECGGYGPKTSSEWHAILAKRPLKQF